MGIVEAFPEDWRVDVIVIRRGGRDSKGGVKPAQQIPVPDCIIAPKGSDESGRASDVATTDAVLYRDPDPDFMFQSTDQIRIPEGSLMAGLWDVAGRPAQTPLGVEVALKEGG
ncbi:hypothetical protein [Glutamicibacter protophormiae]|uniref:hypothetical protein n=1 Tax=Glutamicibacter protophormiae TaxID=37930 RepID=UPI003A905D73